MEGCPAAKVAEGINKGECMTTEELEMRGA